MTMQLAVKDTVLRSPSIQSLHVATSSAVILVPESKLYLPTEPLSGYGC